MARPAAIVTAIVLLVLLGCGNEPAPPSVDYQKQADRAEWALGAGRGKPAVLCTPGLTGLPGRDYLP